MCKWRTRDMLYLIATIKKDANNVVGYRIIDSAAVGKGKATKDVSVTELEKAMASKQIVLANAELKDGKVVTTNGALSRYTTINMNNEVVGEASCVILCRIKPKNDFVVVNFDGNAARLTNEQAIEISSKVGIANGKIVERDGKKIVSSIVGEYPTIEEAPQTHEIKDKFVTVSDKDSEDEILKKVAMHFQNPEIKLIGKLGKEKSDRVLKQAAINMKLVELVQQRDFKGVADAIRKLSTSYMPVLAKICDKRMVIENTAGLKAVYKDVMNENDDFIDKAIEGMQANKVNFK